MHIHVFKLWGTVERRRMCGVWGEGLRLMNKWRLNDRHSWATFMLVICLACASLLLCRSAVAIQLLISCRLYSCDAHYGWMNCRDVRSMKIGCSSNDYWSAIVVSKCWFVICRYKVTNRNLGTALKCAFKKRTMDPACTTHKAFTAQRRFHLQNSSWTKSLSCIFKKLKQVYFNHLQLEHHYMAFIFGTYGTETKYCIWSVMSWTIARRTWLRLLHYYVT